MDNMDDRPIPESYWVIPAKFLAGAYPGEYDRDLTRVKMTAFLNAGFDAFFDLTSENELPPYQPILLEDATHYERQVIHRRFSISDYGIPSRSGMLLILDAIDQVLLEGHCLYLHCWGGIGRTGTTVGCYLVRHGLSGKEALQKLDVLYHTAAQSKLFPVSPENSTQVDFILNWHEI
jgi:hypothetical protein